MASEARQRVEAQLERKREAEEAEATARLLGRAAQLKERSAADGVLAFLRKPVERARPNERYLQNTLRGMNFANRRADEAEMWERLEHARARERRERRARIAEQRRAGRQHGWQSDDGEVTGSDSAGDRHAGGGETADEEVHEEAGVGEGQEATQLESFLAGKRARGRGAVGSRVEDAGPYLPGGATAARAEGDGVAGGARPPQGPDAPPWLRRGGSPSISSSSGSGEREAATRKKRKRKSTKRKKDGTQSQKKRKRDAAGRKHGSKKAKKSRKEAR
mmetsp:Transcript_13396/g.33755  ORF Transcript_13396/g.33755 Transcript_13396/m.33755 type:complete len:277 (-) Transcript_13396:515-1345(-)